MPPPVRPIEIKPAPGVGDKVEVERAAPAIPKPAATDVAKANDKEDAKKTLPSNSSQALVPVGPVETSSTMQNGVAGGVGIRRLPPVGKEDATVVAQLQQRLTDGAIPIYPTTGLE
jgi:hypothetical protein